VHTVTKLSHALAARYNITIISYLVTSESFRVVALRDDAGSNERGEVVHAEVDHKVAQITTDITRDYWSVACQYCKQRPLYFEEIHSVELSFCSYPHVVFDCNL
jgi:hypothetical protein